jgi:hypothetical protein
MKTSQESAFAAGRVPISIILECRRLERGRWSFTDWQVVGAVAGQRFAGDELKCALVHSEGRSQQYLWSGLYLTLYKDSAESYWHNLVGKQPSLFVICAPRGGYEMAPLMVSADYGEAAAFMETDAKVFATPIPPEIYRWLEDYVLNNYVPQEPKRRQRQKWSGHDPREGHR